MRVITGEYRGRKLETPAGYDIRPTSDKVKESIFNLLMGCIDDSVFCDLFAGTGSLGIEALSRGAERCYFCDKSRESIGIIKRNVQHCHAEEKSVILQGDFTKSLSRINEKVDRKSTRLNSSHPVISYAVFCLKKKKHKIKHI